MKLVKSSETVKRSPRPENAPTVSVYFGGEGDSPDLGFVHIRVPPGGGMQEHRHNGSDIVLLVVRNSVVIGKGEESATVEEGDAILILRDEAVTLANPNDTDSEVYVAAGPATFVSDGVMNFPPA